MEHKFPFGIFRPEKQDYLFRCSVAPGNCPQELSKTFCSICFIQPDFLGTFCKWLNMQPMHPRNLVPTKSSVRTCACSCYRMWNASHPCYDLLTAVTIGYLLTSVTWLYRGLRRKIHWGDVFYLIFLLPGYCIQLIPGLQNFTSERHFLKVPTRASLLAWLNLNLSLNLMMYSYICSMVYVVGIVLKVITIPSMSCIVQLTAPCFLFEINTDAVRFPQTKVLAAIYIWDLLSSYCVVLQTFSCKGEGSSKRQLSTFTWNSQHPSSHMNKTLHKKIDQICCGQIYVTKNGNKDCKYCIGILNFIGF